MEDSILVPFPHQSARCQGIILPFGIKFRYNVILLLAWCASTCVHSCSTSSVERNWSNYKNRDCSVCYCSYVLMYNCHILLLSIWFQPQMWWESKLHRLCDSCDLIKPWQVAENQSLNYFDFCVYVILTILHHLCMQYSYSASLSLKFTQTARHGGSPVIPYSI
jgi:hypothetical protein